MSYQFNLYNTARSPTTNALPYDCLVYHVYREKVAYQELSDVVDEIIQYCFRPESNIDTSSFEDFVDPLLQKLTFEELRMANITAQQLLSWSIPVEVAERYQYYLNDGSSLFNGHIYNCTKPSFGLSCQYSFDFDKSMSFEQIVDADFRGRTGYVESNNMTNLVPCYILLKCHRNGQPWCLDWREVCDGKVDCFDESLDEQFCFDMEMNECDEQEYRCHNGMCIAEDLWEDGNGDADCLDRSDTGRGIFNTKTCVQDPTFRCEEHSCAPHVQSFSCGDGQCVAQFKECQNGRHELLRQSISAKGNLTDECWHAMLCLTGLVTEDNGDLCNMWFMNITVYAGLERCGLFFQFPTVAVYSNHIRLLYHYPHLKLNLSEFLVPNYICYDQQLCDFITLDLVYDNLTCIKPEKTNLFDGFDNSWTDLLTVTELYFRSCSLPQITFHEKPNFSNRSNFYKCSNSSKFISMYRLMDDKQDCSKDDDEKYENSCSLNDRYRVQCSSATECWSSSVKYDVCKRNGLYNQEELPFQAFCDGINKYFYDNKGQKYTDEFGCSDWLCNNMYTRCDGFWTCIDGRDEASCGRKICPSQTYACISPITYNVSCLPFDMVNNGPIDCLGALDEQLLCRTLYPPKDIAYLFHCRNDSGCLQLSQLCDGKIDCPTDNVDEDFCKYQQFSCDQKPAYNRNDIEEILCGLDEIVKRRVRYFSVYTSTNYPSSETSPTTEFTYRSNKQNHHVENVNVSQYPNNVWPWYCNRGIIIHVRNQNNESVRRCLCPPSYYGHLCQYQSQRVSVTLRLASGDRHATYEIIMMLINEERQEIDAHDQFVYIVKQSCTTKLNRYLLYRIRPKNISNNYSVRIDTYEKNALTYIGSWYFPIDFLFLPVNRLGISLNLSHHVLQHSSNCSVTCKNGKCVRYVNKNEYFCHCNPQWSGNQCDTPVQCHQCSLDSVCIGSSRNQAICVCPIGKFGTRCSLTSTCPINACQNNGQCVPPDLSIVGSTYTCICTDLFSGPNCEYRKATLDVSFNQLVVPKYLIAYFYTLSNESEPIETVILRKLTLFQHTVTFHIAVPFQLTFIQINNKYYLATLQQSPKQHIVTSISPKQECISVTKLFNSTVRNLIPYRRIIHYHYLCHTLHQLTCFIDKTYLCLCTNDHHANCLKFNGERHFECLSTHYCENNGRCLQDHPNCPSTKMCLCPSCYFGSQCQFYAKSLGSTLDEILGYEIKRGVSIFQQPVTVQFSAVVHMIIFLIGIISSTMSIMLFSRKKTQEVGCGTYILGSSLTSLCTMILFVLKFWLLFFSYHDDHGQSNQQRIFRVNCYIEPILKWFLYLDGWFNACVSVERTISVCVGVTFNKSRSKKASKWIIRLLCLIITSLFVPQLLHLQIFNDPMEERSWCVIKTTSWLRSYSVGLIIIHYFGPLITTIGSAVFIVGRTTYQKVITQPEHDWRFHLKSRITHYRHILISFAINVCLTLPHLIISLILDCKKSSFLIWFYLLGYFLSFLPAAFVCVIFIIPSPLYRKEFEQLQAHIRRRLEILRLNWF